ncbi:putative amino acid permease [Lyophyllum shimeji]|uniref:Amino acid permease n=1 Tax=Lyophyllum shimeji TaxID=47721 RepID=A0A9P3PF89_LYOSH|nr:putative amino acid permease [Lyophyllum shimeji]
MTTPERTPSKESSYHKEELALGVESQPEPEAPPRSKARRIWEKVSSGAAEGNETQRGMQSRHLMMIAIGGTIGTGIFLSAGSAIALAGPGSTLLSYFVVGLFVYSVVITL